MANTRNIMIDDVDKRPPLPPRSPHAIISYADAPTPQGVPLVAYLPWPAWVVGGVLVAAFGGVLLYWIVGALRHWAESSPLAAWLALFLPAAAVISILCVGVYWLAGKAYYSIARSRAAAYQALLTRWRLGTPIAADQVANAPVSLLLGQEQAANMLELGRAPYTKHPVLASLSEGNHESSEATIYGAGDAEQAPAGVPPADWLRWIDDAPHLMIAGRTNAGKTTLASAILAERIQGGDEVLVIDPHDQPDKWYGIQAIGGGRQYGEILTMLDRVVAEMDARYQAFNSGTPTAAFTRLTVLVDEVPAIMDACLNERRRVVDARWSNFARQLGSEARKVRISVILLTQSALVQDIGVNTAMRKNFSRIALGDEARQLLSEESNSERRGVDRSSSSGQALIISAIDGSLVEVELDEDYTQALSYVYALGEGALDEQAIGFWEDTTLSASSALGRTEGAVNQTQTDLGVMLEGVARRRLWEKRPRKAMVCKVAETEQATFGEEYDWGDKVVAQFFTPFINGTASGVLYDQRDARVDPVHITVDRSEDQETGAVSYIENLEIHLRSDG